MRLFDSKFGGENEFDYSVAGDVTKDRYAVTRVEAADDEGKHWERTLGYISKINELCLENGIRFLLVAYPYGHQVSSEEWSGGRHLFGFERGEVYSSRADDILREFAESEGIEFVSLFDAFKDSSEYPLYFPYDGHFNAKGHRLVGEVLARELGSQDLKRGNVFAQPREIYNG